MLCPHCNTEMSVPDIVQRNVQSYQSSVNIAAPCCKRPLHISPVFSVHVGKSYTKEERDDWNTPYAKS